MLLNKTSMENVSMVKPELLTPQLAPKKYPAPTVAPSPSPEAPVAAGPICIEIPGFPVYPICTGNADKNR